MSTSRFRVYGRFDGASEATVEIDRDVGLVRVRPLRRHRCYELPLAWVAEAVIWKVIKAEVAQRRREKKAAGKAR